MSTYARRDAVVAIIGTTGTGKSQIAVDLARRFDGEIINADAVQMYDGLPVITNKISVAEQKGVPHHLLGCIGLDEPPWRVDKFVRKAGEVIQDIQRRGKLPIIVGGTHYYTQSLIFRDSLAEVEGSRQSLADESKGVEDRFPFLDDSTEMLLDRLRTVDPVMAQRWHPSDRRKIRRSLEIYYKTGRRASDVYGEQQSKRAMASPSEIRSNDVDSQGDTTISDVSLTSSLAYPTMFLWMHAPKPVLEGRLRERVDQMVDTGLPEEARELHDFSRKQLSDGREIDTTRGVYISIGYKELLPYLEVSEGSDADLASREKVRQEAIERVKIATRQYAKYQERWIRTKLLSAIKMAGIEDSIRVLDTSKTDAWDEDVAKPASTIVTAFLEGSAIPQTTFSYEARRAVEEAFADSKDTAKGISQTRTCKACDVTATTESEWQQHITSGRHRKTLKWRQKQGVD